MRKLSIDPIELQYPNPVATVTDWSTVAVNYNSTAKGTNTNICGTFSIESDDAQNGYVKLAPENSSVYKDNSEIQIIEVIN